MDPNLIAIAVRGIERMIAGLLGGLAVYYGFRLFLVDVCTVLDMAPRVFDKSEPLKWTADQTARSGIGRSTNIWLLRSACVLFLLTAGIHAQTKVDSSTLLPAVVSPGQKVTIKGTFDKLKTATAVFHLVGAPQAADRRAPGVVADDGSSVTFSLPGELSTGRYFLTISQAGDVAEQTVPGELNIRPAAVVLESTNPTTAYRSGVNGGFNFDLIGQNFDSDYPQDNDVIITGQGSIIRSTGRTEAECDSKPATNLPCLWVSSTRLIHVTGYQGQRYQGPLKVRVRVGQATSEEKDLLLARMSGGNVLVWTVVGFGALCWLVYRLVAASLRDRFVQGHRLSLWQSFLLDKQSETYSLSKFQFFAFSLVFIFGYSYVLLCRWLVQWQFTLPNVPNNVSGLLAISAATTVVAVGVTATRGTKGGGEIYPSPGDFVTTGGMVVPERFQFFVWTLIACLGFLVLLISQDPATLRDFPTFPDGLLYIMGVSSAGYLAGKITRQAGPVIKNIAVAMADPNIPEITVQGENLSNKADFSIDGKKLPLVPEAERQSGEPKGDLVTDDVPQDQRSDPTFCTQLKIKVIKRRTEIALATADHTFRIMNPDGQFADAPFTADPTKIEDVVMDGATAPKADTISSGKSPVTILIHGSGFRAGMTARWIAPNQAPVDLEPSAVQLVDEKNLKLTLIPGELGTGVLMLMTRSGFAATKNVRVE